MNRRDMVQLVNDALSKTLYRSRLDDFTDRDFDSIVENIGEAIIPDERGIYAMWVWEHFEIKLAVLTNRQVIVAGVGGVKTGSYPLRRIEHAEEKYGLLDLYIGDEKQRIETRDYQKARVFYEALCDLIHKRDL